MSVSQARFKPTNLNKIHTLTAQPLGKLPSLASCPWPSEGSHCSPWTIWIDASESGYPVWGEYDGNPDRKRFYAQTSFLDVSRINRLVFKVKKGVTTPSQPLYIGLMGLDTLNDPAKMYDPSKWPWAGYLTDLPTTQDHYSICADINDGFWTTNPLFLFFCTDAPYQTWYPIGYTAQSGLAPLNKYSLNEPGQSDGWTEMDDYHHLLFIPYTNGAGAILEGFCQIENPDFPGTAEVGTPYNFSFDVDQQTAFPCGCPETIVYQIYNRDNGTPIGTEITFDLACGYGGVSGMGSHINFTGMGTFHGQLKVGHKLNGSWQVDDTHNFDVVVSTGDCSGHTTKTTCENNGCWWWNGSCHDNQPTSCSQLNNDSDCTRWSCYWCNGACQGTPCDGEVTLTEAHTCDGPEQCEGHSSESTCENDADCDWYSFGCGPRTDYGWWFPKKSTFGIDELLYLYFQLNGNDLYGVTYTWKWYHNDVMVWEDSRTISDHWTGFSQCLWWTIGQPGTGYIKIYADGEYIGKTNTYTINPPSGVFGEIYSLSPRYGPKPPGTEQVVGFRELINTGTNQGILHDNLYAFPNTPSEILLQEHTINAPVGTPMGGGYSQVLPSTPQVWPLGIKTWGISESEPAWGTLNKTATWNFVVGTCETATTQTDCENAGCYWCNGICQSTPCGGNVLAEIVKPSSIFYTGPFAPGEVETLAKVRVKNAGDVAGRIWYCDFFYPGQSNEKRGTTAGYGPVGVGESKDVYPANRIPIDAPSILPTGVKVWGEDESEPSWSNQDKTHQWDVQIIATDICAWIVAQIPGYPNQPVTDISVQSVFALLDSYISQTPPSGYSFVPTIQQVFGVVDYYLGVNGDSSTGCNLF